MKVGFTTGVFDLLHTGHVTMFKECRKNCDILIVGLQVDPTVNRTDKNKPIQSVFERYMQLLACKYVHRVYPYETESDLRNMLLILKPDIRFLGSDYINGDKRITGKELIDIKYIDRQHSYSTSELRERIKNGNK